MAEFNYTYDNLSLEVVSGANANTRNAYGYIDNAGYANYSANEPASYLHKVSFNSI